MFMMIDTSTPRQPEGLRSAYTFFFLHEGYGLDRSRIVGGDWQPLELVASSSEIGFGIRNIQHSLI